MLCLNSNNVELVLNMDHNYFYIDNISYSDTNVLNRGPIFAKNIRHALLPLHMNQIAFKSDTLVVRNIVLEEKDNKENLKETIVNLYNRAGMGTDLYYLKIYTNKVNDLFELVKETKLFKEADTTIKSLYNKCAVQTKERNGLDADINCKVMLSKLKNIIVLIADYDDTSGASLDYLTIGLIPVLFKNIKEKLNEDELNYFKEFVSRSQLKRITNVKITELFQKLNSLQKYRGAALKFRYDNIKNTFKINRRRTNENKIRDIEYDLKGILDNYERKIEELDKVKLSLLTCDEDVKKFNEDLDEVSKIKEIVDINISNQTVYFLLKVPLSFYAQDELELCLDNVTKDRPNWTKQFLKDVFIDNKYTLNVVTNFKLDLRTNNSFDYPGGRLAPDTLYEHNAHINPHLYFYNCVGNYGPDLVKTHKQKDVLMYINIAIACSKSINFKDSTVLNTWLNKLEHSLEAKNNGRDNGEIGLVTTKCLEDEEGNTFSISEIYGGIE